MPVAHGLWQDEIERFRPGEFRIKRAELAVEILGHHAIRRRAFVEEQAIFADDDRDALDRDAIRLVAIACVHGDCDEVVGAVRLNETAPGLWWGSRLCVARAFRGVVRAGGGATSGLGAELVRFAVATARGEGCERFLAHVQAQNVGMFRHLGWALLEEVMLHGRPHGVMQAELGRFAPRALPFVRLLPPPAGGGDAVVRAR